MLAALTTGTATACMAVVVPLIVVFVLALLIGLANMSPQQRAMRERRRHAERTASTMRRMTEIRRQTARRMDRAEGRRQR